MKFYIYTLGCKVNTYESQVIHDMLINNNYVEDENADIYIINTCTVTNTSDNKSLKVVRRCIRNNPNAIIVVMGCMTQTSPDLLNNIGGIQTIITCTGLDDFVNNRFEYDKVFKVSNGIITSEN